jgi:hypothetical protein
LICLFIVELFEFFVYYAGIILIYFFIFNVYNNMDIKKKYLKYKYKYTQLKLLLDQIGGDKPSIRNIDNINPFRGSKIEEYLNPIYGLIMCESGYIKNLYYLSDKADLNDHELEEKKIIKNIARIIPGEILPTRKIMKLRPIDFGRFIMIAYINFCLEFDFVKFEHTKKEIKLIIDQKYKDGLGIDNVNKIIAYINKMNNYKYFPLFTVTKSGNKQNKNIFINNDYVKNCFRFVLFCFWWIADNDEGIENYNEGMFEILEMCNFMKVEFEKNHDMRINEMMKNEIRINDMNVFESEKTRNIIELFNHDMFHMVDGKFEQKIIDICKKNFKIYNQDQSYNFCGNNKTYADCGEVTSRNLINLICFDGKKFDIEILNGLGAIQEIQNYYKIFNDFDKQSSNDVTMDFDNFTKLNSRDAWSYIIIHHANKDIGFTTQCENNNIIKFEMNAGMSLNKNKSNFLQLVNNLLSKVQSWNDIKVNSIDNVEDNTENGIGDIIISCKTIIDDEENNEEYIIHCEKQHYYMENTSENTEIINDRQYFYGEKYYFVKILLGDVKIVTDETHLLMNYNSEILTKVLYDYYDKYKTKTWFNLFELSTTNLFNSDTRSRILLNFRNIDIHDIYDKKILSLLNTDISNDYTYEIETFDFIKYLPKLTHLNSNIYQINENINLSQLSNITSIGDGFLEDCEKLEAVDLSPLSNVTSIGHGFLKNCSMLSYIKLSPLLNVTSIGDDFLSGCEKLQKIDLSPLSNVTSIGDDFLSGCEELKDINLSSLDKITSIGDNFLSGCEELKDINLSSLDKITSIGHGFLYDCKKLEKLNMSLFNITSINENFLENCESLISIDISSLSNVISIGDSFLSGCDKLTEIDLSSLKKITSINKNFLSHSTELQKIDLSPLSNVTSIGDNFFTSCEKIQNINLIPLSNVTSIGDDFLTYCENLENIDLTPLSNATSIGDEFLASCEKLENIKMSFLNVTSIGNKFLYHCESLTDIDLTSLSNVTSIENDFLAYCEKLKNIDLEPLSNVTSIGNDFLTYCEELQNIDLKPLSNVTSIKDSFLNKCKNLTSIDVGPLENCESIGDNFLYECDKLKSIENMQIITKILDNDFYDNEHLERFITNT